MLHLRLCCRKGLCCLLVGVLLGTASLSGCGDQPAKSHPEQTAETVSFAAVEEATQPSEEQIVESAAIRYLLEREWITIQDVRTQKDSSGTLSILTLSLSELLTRVGITELVNDKGEMSSVRNYGSWYLYAVGDVCSLFYMRSGIESSGVGVSFIELDFEALKTCLESGETQAHLKDMLTAVTVASAVGRHSEVLTGYFGDPLSGGSYLMAETFAEFVASGALDGIVAAPVHYATCSVEDAEFLRVTKAPVEA